MIDSIPAPKGFRLPEGVDEGEPFKLLATFRLNGKRLEVLELGDAADDEEQETMAQAVIRQKNQPPEDADE